MLSVGIHENVIVSKAIINEQGTLEVEFAQPGTTDALAALTGKAELIQEQSINIRMYGQNVDYFGEKRTGEKMFKLIVGFQSILTELLQNYIDNPEINASKGIKVTQENINTIFTDQAIVDIAYKNIVEQFVALITPFVGKTEHKFRVKLPRRSKKYAFAALPTFGPWVENMAIPADASKLKWTNWEISNGRNHDLPVKDETTQAAKEDGAKAVAELDDVFNKNES
jgi:hypothetical protein